MRVYLLSGLSAFSFGYPFLMAWYWMLGGLLYAIIRHKVPPPWAPPPLESYPLVSVLVPCHDESEQLDETLSALAALAWPSYEVIAIDDGSTDDTWAAIEEQARQHPFVVGRRHASNRGIAAGWKTGVRSRCKNP